MAPSRYVLSIIELFKQYYQHYTGQEYSDSLHDVNVIMESFPKTSNFWQDFHLWGVLINKYFAEPRGIYSIDKMITMWRRGLLQGNGK